MNLIKRFFEWILGWIIFGVVVLSLGWLVSMFIDDDNNTTKSASSTEISEDAKLIEIRKTYWDNGNIKDEVPYKKSYGLGYKKVKTKLVPHGIAKEYYENGVLKKEDPYIEGERTGVMKFYDENGSIEVEANFVNSKREGKTTYYDSDGSIMEEEYYTDGNITDTPNIEAYRD
jgi:antitoxin component YwqK of YwqJK toxin-antitoxin module